MNTVKMYDDLDRKVRLFEPLHGNRVNMYVCGVTVYGPCHIGHARAYIAFDVIRRWLEYRGFDVNYIQNFTDVDDKIINKAKAEGVDIGTVAGRYIDEYFRDMDALGVKRASVYPRATEYIPEMIGMVKTLIEKGFAYESDGNVFYEVAAFPGYGKLSGRGVDELPMQEPAPGKRSNADFALWKKSVPGEPGWDSPFGFGRPGWHLECSAMSLKIAGGTLDIHGGGKDLIFPHHENEIAQSEAFSGEQFSRYWMHNGFIEVDKEKMSKSLGNITNVHDVLGKSSGGAMRFFFLNAHYRMPLNFTFDRLVDAENALERFRTFFASVRRISGRVDGAVSPSAEAAAAIGELESHIAEAQLEFEKTMDDDFNTPSAISHLFTLLRRANSFMASVESSSPGKAPAASVEVLTKAADKMLFLAGLMGLDLSAGGKEIAEPETVEKLLEILIGARAEARALKQWKLADLIRDRLAEAGFVLEDRPDGTSWKRQ